MIGIEMIVARAFAWEAWCDSSGNPEHDRMDAEAERAEFNAGWDAAVRYGEQK